MKYARSVVLRTDSMCLEEQDNEGGNECKLKSRWAARTRNYAALIPHFNFFKSLKAHPSPASHYSSKRRWEVLLSRRVQRLCWQNLSSDQVPLAHQHDKTSRLLSTVFFLHQKCHHVMYVRARCKSFKDLIQSLQSRYLDPNTQKSLSSNTELQT